MCIIRGSEMRKFIFFMFLFYCRFLYGQLPDIETKLYDLFDFSGSSFLTGSEDLRYHPALKSFSSLYSMNLKMNYHDIYREWSADNNYKSSSQYDMGIETRFPFEFFSESFNVNIEILKQNLYSALNDKNNEIHFRNNNSSNYSINSGILWDDGRDKAGLRLKYTSGVNGVLINVNSFPSDESDEMLNKYFYHLLEPAFGNNINMNLRGNEFNYAFEYTRSIIKDLKLGINFYQDNNNQNIGINYYGSVVKIEGPKYLDGFLQLKSYVIGLSAEYRLGGFILRTLASHSAPEYKISLSQNNSIVRNNVNLEIKDLVKGNLEGNGNAAGLGISYEIKDGMNSSLGYTFIENVYSGILHASTPVLGYEILPIAHQVNLGFSDIMENNLFSLRFNHKVSRIWDYSVSLEYLISQNDINYNYMILTEFGFGNDKENQNTARTIYFYRINLDTKLAVTEEIAVKILFSQLVPVIKKENIGENVTGQPPQPGQPVSSKINNWGGAVYGLSLVYNFN